MLKHYPNEVRLYVITFHKYMDRYIIDNFRKYLARILKKRYTSRYNSRESTITIIDKNNDSPVLYSSSARVLASFNLGNIRGILGISLRLEEGLDYKIEILK